MPTNSHQDIHRQMPITHPHPICTLQRTPELQTTPTRAPSQSLDSKNCCFIRNLYTPIPPSTPAMAPSLPSLNHRTSNHSGILHHIAHYSAPITHNTHYKRIYRTPTAAFPKLTSPLPTTHTQRSPPDISNFCPLHIDLPTIPPPSHAHNPRCSSDIRNSTAPNTAF